MLKKKFVQIESNFQEYFTVGRTFPFENKIFTVKKSGKPTISSGEPKTDMYILGIDKNGFEKEFKISIKLKNNEFPENKLSLDRAKNILGEDAQKIIEKSIKKIKNKFSKLPLIDFTKDNRQKSRLVTLGWRLDFVNKKRNLSVLIDLDKKQKIEVFSGKACADKADACVGGEIIKDSGIANFVYVKEEESVVDEKIFEKLISVSDYAEMQDIYIALNAVNYRIDNDKWEGNRHLAVWVKRKLKNNKLKEKLIFKDPLVTRCNFVGESIKNILDELKISLKNFDDLKEYIKKNSVTIV